MDLPFECDSAAEVDALSARLIAAGHTRPTAWETHIEVERRARVADPDGLFVDSSASLEG